MYPAAADADTPKRLEGHGGPVRAITMSPDGTAALTASFDYSIIHWKIDTGKATIVARLFGHNAAVNDVAFTPDGARAISASDDGTLGVWDLEKNVLIRRLTGHQAKVIKVAVSPDGKWAASAGWDGTARIWDLENLQPAHVLRGHKGNVNSVTFSIGGDLVLSAGYDGSIRAWETSSGRSAHVVFRYGWGINVLRPLPDGKTLLIGSLDGTVGLVDIQTGTMRELTKHTGPVLSAAVWPAHGLAATGGGDGTIRVWKLDTWKVEHVQENAYGPVWALALSGDGTTIYHAGLDDFVIGWTISPNNGFEPVASVFPRRFQLTDSMGAGEREFTRKCSICHTLEPDGGNRAGPTLYGLFGRRAGSVEGYPYSPGLSRSTIVWNSDTIGQLFDLGPDRVTPGSKMPLQRLKSVEARDELIAFLKMATEPNGHGIMEDSETSANQETKPTGAE